ncbi:tripartite tricarboxylate transporter substrate binding protein [Massilia sp. Mn16-1_5]|uniref:tripartite tricarboxylate transporter substrate binding protein n=1 Tax=Massilia sp. Mn16-1_5 TaxID=2079199 RepID=UPI00109E40E8|nr:tripartite tricarboxylate transporter substrate binding protein [Massilia sp. Mn16-1_5]THC43408.1 Tat pathway signal protein [Massilia sp. Mn16-1_5]
MNMQFLKLPLLAAGLICGSVANLVHAADAYPSKVITMVVPFPPGGVADTVARPVAAAMEKHLKGSIIIENKGGAGGAIGMGQVARAAPDGYTVLMALSSISIIPEADKVTGRKPLYQMAQLKPVARFTADPTVLVVRADSPWKTLAEFVAAVRSKPGAYSFGSSGNYGTMHVPMEMLKSEAKLHLLHVPYTGAAPAVMALLSDQVTALSTGPASVAQHVKAGKLRVLAHWGSQPLAAFPGVPSLKEAGYPVEFAQWSGLFVPSETPDAVVAKLREAAKAAANDPQVRQVMNGAGSPLQYLDTPEFQAYIAEDSKKLKEAVHRIGKVE